MSKQSKQTNPVITKLEELKLGWTPKPNWYSLAEYYLPPPACKLLNYICRKTFGWSQFSDFISYSQFAKGGVTDRAGKMDRGTGLSNGAISNGLKILRRSGLVTGKGKSKKGLVWTPALDPQQVDWEYLKSLKAAKDLPEEDAMSNLRELKERKKFNISVDVTIEEPFEWRSNEPIVISQEWYDELNSQ